MVAPRLSLLLLVVVGCGGPKPAGEPPRPGAPDAAAPITPAAADAGAAASSCPADVCCRMPDGTMVHPGGCQPSYPDNVQPATVRGDDGACEPIECYLKCLPATARIATPSGE